MKKSTLVTLAVVLSALLAVGLLVVDMAAQKSELSLKAEVLDSGYIAARQKMQDVHNRLMAEMMKIRQERAATMYLWGDNQDLFEAIQEKTRQVKELTHQQSLCDDRLNEFRHAWTTAIISKSKEAMEEAERLFKEAEDLLKEIEERLPRPKKPDRSEVI